MGEQGALEALKASGIAHEIVRHGPVLSLAEAAAARGVEPAAVVKTIVVRRGDDDSTPTRTPLPSPVTGERT